MSGWWNYYGLTESFNRLRPLHHWIRRRLRALIWKHWPPAPLPGRLPARRAYASQRKTAKPVWVNPWKEGCLETMPWRQAVPVKAPGAWARLSGLISPYLINTLHHLDFRSPGSDLAWSAESRSPPEADAAWCGRGELWGFSLSRYVKLYLANFPSHQSL